MIPINELRVGNYWTHKSGIYRIEIPIQISDASVLGDGIPITPEILNCCLPRPLSFGFETQFTKTGRLEIILGNCYATVADTLHEYQNLIFALTGCEIEFAP